MDLFENDYRTAVGMQDDAFAFMQYYCTKLYYSSIAFVFSVQYEMEWRYSYPECNAKVTIWQQIIGIFSLTIDA